MSRSIASRNTELLLLALLAAGTVLLLQWQYGFNWSDEGWLWYISQRTTLGQVPVRDIFSYEPGRYYWSAAVFKILGREGFFEQLLANYLFGALGLLVTLITMAGSELSRGWRIAVLFLLAVVLGFPRHKIFEQTLSLVAAAGITFILASPEKPKRWFINGLAIGLTAFIGRNSGLYFAIAAVLAFIVLKFRRRAPQLKPAFAALITGIVIGYSPMLFMMLHFRGFASAFVQSVLLTPKWSWPLPIPFPWHSHASGFHGLDALQMRAVSWLCIVVPATYALLIWRASRADSGGALRLALGASIAGIPYLHHAYYHADFPHMAQGVVPFVLVTGAVSQHWWTAGKHRISLLCFSALGALVLACWLPMEPLVQHLRTKAVRPQIIDRISLDGRTFEVPAPQAQVMRTVETVFRSCGARDGVFLAAPYYPGLYAFLKTKAPFWDTYYLWPRSEELQRLHIQALVDNHTSLVLLNRDASFDGQEWLRIERTYPKLVDYILSNYKRLDAPLPSGFEIYYLPHECHEVSSVGRGQ